MVSQSGAEYMGLRYFGNGYLLLGRMLVFVSEVIIGVSASYLLACGFRVSIANMTQNSPGLGIPMALAYGAVPIGALAGLIQLVPLVFDSFNGNC